MEEQRKGFILTIDDVERSWRIEQGATAEGHHNMQGYGFLTVASEAAAHGMRGKELSKHLMLGLDRFPPGGGIMAHCHEYNVEMPIFDHAYYVISGRILATVGDIEKTVGANSLIYCPSNIKHSILNVGKTTAKVLRLAACGEGETMGGWVDKK